MFKLWWWRQTDAMQVAYCVTFYVVTLGVVWTS